MLNNKKSRKTAGKRCNVVGKVKVKCGEEQDEYIATRLGKNCDIGVKLTQCGVKNKESRNTARKRCGDGVV